MSNNSLKLLIESKVEKNLKEIQKLILKENIYFRSMHFDNIRNYFYLFTYDGLIFSLPVTLFFNNEAKKFWEELNK